MKYLYGGEWRLFLLIWCAISCINMNPAPDRTISGNVVHVSWDNMLKQYVSANGVVDYTSWKTELGTLQKLVSEMGNSRPGVQASNAEKMAYWINLYNASTVLLILDNYPVRSIMDLDNGKVWDRKWITSGDETLSLNNIENDILRPKFKDARIHFAVNCAAKSCPPLLNSAWTASMLDETLDERVKAFINHPSYNKISPDAVKISRIFEWYKGDFGDLIGFLNKYSKIRINKQVRVAYIDYNWALNGK